MTKGGSTGQKSSQKGEHLKGQRTIQSNVHLNKEGIANQHRDELRAKGPMVADHNSSDSETSEDSEGNDPTDEHKPAHNCSDDNDSDSIGSNLATPFSRSASGPTNEGF